MDRPIRNANAMDRFIHDANVALYRRLLAESRSEPSRDDNRHNMLLRLLAEEKEATDKMRRNG